MIAEYHPLPLIYRTKPFTHCYFFYILTLVFIFYSYRYTCTYRQSNRKNLHSIINYRNTHKSLFKIICSHLFIKYLADYEYIILLLLLIIVHYVFVFSKNYLKLWYLRALWITIRWALKKNENKPHRNDKLYFIIKFVVNVIFIKSILVIK